MAIKKKDNTEQRTLLAILLAMGLYGVWTLFFAPKAPENPDVVPAEPTAQVDPTGPTAPTADPGLPAEPVPAAREVDVETGEIRAVLSSHGGSLRQVYLPNYKEPYIATPIWKAAIQAVKGEKPISEWQAYEKPEGEEQVTSELAVVLAAGSGESFREGEYQLEGNGPWTAKRRLDNGVVLTKTWAETDDPRVLDVTITWENASGGTITDPLWIGSWDQVDEMGGMMSRYNSIRQVFGYVKGDYEVLQKLSGIDKKGAKLHKGPTGWLGIGDRYFLVTAVPDVPDWGSFRFDKGPGDAYGAFVVKQIELGPGDVETLNFQVVAGKRDLKALKALGSDLDKAVDLGFFGMFARIFLVYLQFLYKLTGNWGVSIILMTVTIKLVFLPLTKRSFESSQRMQELQPEIAKLKERYPNDQQKVGQEQMKLFKQHGVNPMSGCLPMIVQMPVWFALFTVLLYTSELYQTPFLIWDDLSVVDPFAILPAIVGSMMLLQQRMTPTSPTMDPNQQRMMKMMPLIFVAFYFTFPAGLAIYSTTNISLSILQMWLIRKRFAKNGPKPPISTPATA